MITWRTGLLGGGRRRLAGLVMAGGFVWALASSMVFTVSAAANPDMGAAFFSRILPFHQVKTPPGPYDWLAQHAEEGQTFAQYLASRPSGPEVPGNLIYFVLLGDFDPRAREVMDQTARFVEAYFDRPVKWLSPIPLASLPGSAQRIHPQTGDKQILTTYVIDEILKPARPADALCLVAFTASDLWPGQGWNFVFGQASAEDRVGVWSVFRNGDPKAGLEAYRLFLKRTIKTGVHEIGHMFGLSHCIYYECLMNGSNSRKEADSRPLALCPVCLRKLQWALKFEPVSWFQRLADFSGKMGFADDEKFFRASAQALTEAPP